MRFWNWYKRSQRCPVCGCQRVPIIYGFPNQGMIEAEKNGEIKIGGCLVNLNKRHYCVSCEEEG